MKPFMYQLLRPCLICAATILCSCSSASKGESEAVSLELYGPYLTTSSMLTVDVDLEYTALGAGLDDATAANTVVTVDRGLLLRPEGLHGAAAIGTSFELNGQDWLYWLLPDTAGLAGISAGSESGSDEQRIAVNESPNLPMRIDFRLSPPVLAAAEKRVEIEPLFEYLPGQARCNGRPHNQLGQPEFTFHVLTGQLWRTAPQTTDPDYSPINHYPSADVLMSSYKVVWQPYEHAGERPPQGTSLLVVMQWGDLVAARLLEVEAAAP